MHKDDQSVRFKEIFPKTNLNLENRSQKNNIRAHYLRRKLFLVSFAHQRDLHHVMLIEHIILTMSLENLCASGISKK